MRGHTTHVDMRVQKARDGIDAHLIFDESGFMWGKSERCQ